MTDVTKLDLKSVEARLRAPYSRKLKMALRSLHRPFKEHNERAATSGKRIGRKAQVNRRDRVELCIREIHALGYEIEDGFSIVKKHVFALMRLWLAWDLKASTIQNRLSPLRTYLTWIGKGGMIRSADEFLPPGVDPERLRVVTVAQSPKGWAENGVDLKAMLLRVIEKDIRVACVLMLEAALGLRRQEAAVFRPGVCLDRFGGSIQVGQTVDVREGTKGGRLRSVPISDQVQIDVIHLALRFCKRRGDSLVPPGKNLKQFLERLAYVAQSCGMTKANHCNPHALRHTYAVTLYELITGCQAPVRGNGRFAPLEGDPHEVTNTLSAITRIMSAELAVAENLGHSRHQVSRAYLGSVSTGREGGEHGGDT